MANLHTVYLLLGSNLGNRKLFLDIASKKIAFFAEIIKFSSIYETSAWGVENQPNYLNQVLEIRTNLSPMELLDQTQETEKQMGREHTGHWESRNIDIDILIYEDWIVETEKLIIPHLRMQERRFVLVPLTEILQNWTHPKLKKRITELLEDCQDNLFVKKY